MTREQVISNINSLDLMLMTSLVEGSPQIIKETMACSKPIVSTSIGDVADLLKDVSNSYVINSFNYEDFIDPVCQIHALPQEQRKSNGREKIANMGLDEESISNRLFDQYQELLWEHYI